MYINPFMFGVLVTVGAELVAILAAAVIAYWRKK